MKYQPNVQGDRAYTSSITRIEGQLACAFQEASMGSYKNSSELITKAERLLSLLPEPEGDCQKFLQNYITEEIANARTLLQEPKEAQQ